MEKISYNEAKLLCEKADFKSSLTSLVLKKYREKYGDDEILKGLPPLYVRESENYKRHEREAVKAFQELREINKWFMKNFKKEYKKERGATNYHKERQERAYLQREKLERALQNIEVSI